MNKAMARRFVDGSNILDILLVLINNSDSKILHLLRTVGVVVLQGM